MMQQKIEQELQPYIKRKSAITSIVDGVLEHANGHGPDSSANPGLRILFYKWICPFEPCYWTL